MRKQKNHNILGGLIMNRVSISGRLTKDIELRTSDNGSTLGRFTIAVNKKRNGKSTADFIPCVMFGPMAERASEFLKKGVKIEIDGRIQSYPFTVGDKRLSRVSVVVNSWEFAERKLFDSSADTPADNEDE